MEKLSDGWLSGCFSIALKGCVIRWLSVSSTPMVLSCLIDSDIEASYKC